MGRRGRRETKAVSRSSSWEDGRGRFCFFSLTGLFLPSPPRRRSVTRPSNVAIKATILGCAKACWSGPAASALVASWACSAPVYASPNRRRHMDERSSAASALVA